MTVFGKRINITRKTYFEVWNIFIKGSIYFSNQYVQFFDKITVVYHCWSEYIIWFEIDIKTWLNNDDVIHISIILISIAHLWSPHIYETKSNKRSFCTWNMTKINIYSAEACHQLLRLYIYPARRNSKIHTRALCHIFHVTYMYTTNYRFMYMYIEIILYYYSILYILFASTFRQIRSVVTNTICGQKKTFIEEQIFH